MNKIIPLLLISILCSCGNKSTRVKTPIEAPPIVETVATKKFTLGNFLDDFYYSNADGFNNEVTRKKLATKMSNQLGVALKDSSAYYISEIPVQFTQVMQKGNKYIVKFEYSKYNKTDDIHPIFNVSFRIFSVVNEDIVQRLVERKFYYINGTYKGLVENKIELPSGRYFYDRPSLSSNFGISYDLGGLYFTNIDVKIAK